jgi:Ni/Fe-hydrogenase 1 B-type cytochrome subunit
MWAFLVFTVIHIYLVFYHDYVEGHGVMSSIVGGWKFMEKHKIEAEEASGISGLPARPVVPSTRAPAKPAR